MSDIVDIEGLTRHVRGKVTKSKSERDEAALRAKFNLEHLREEILRLYGDEDMPTSEIAERMGINAEKVRHIVRERIAYWQRKGMDSIESKKALVLTRIEQLENLALESYYLSMQGKEVEIIETHIEGKTRKGKYVNQHGKSEESPTKGTNFRKDPIGPLDVDNAVPPYIPNPESLFEQDVDDTGEVLPEEPTFDGDEEFDRAFENEYVYKVKSHKKIESVGPGDPRFLAVAQWAQQMKIKLWGLDRPEEEQDDIAKILTPLERDKKVTGLLQQVRLRLAEKQQINAAMAGTGPIVSEVHENDVVVLMDNSSNGGEE